MADTLVYIAGGCFALGYLVIHQMILRLFLLIGSLLYLWYYFVAADVPLWGAIHMSTLMVMTNLIGIAALSWRNARASIPRQHRDIYPHFSTMAPGDFRNIMALAERRVLNQAEAITQQGASPERLSFVVSGRVEVEKQGTRFHMPAGIFAGEVAYLLNQRSAATMRLEAGAEIVSWDMATLRAQSARNARSVLALEAMISKDLARKVSYATAPQTRVLAVETKG